MTNRNRLLPILLTATLSVAASPVLFCQAEPGVPTDSTNPAPAAAVVPTPPPTTPATLTAPIVSAPATSGGTVAPADRPATYTVVTGDSLWLIAQKFGCSVKSLKKVNNFTKNNLKPGQVIKLPPVKTKTTTPAPATKPSASTTTHKKTDHQKLYAHAQPVQDFDIPASTFASCPVPDPATIPDAAPTPPSSVSSSDMPDTTETSAPVAKLVSPEELTAEPPPAPKIVAAVKPAPTPVVAKVKPAPAPVVQLSQGDSSSASTFTSPSSKQNDHKSFFSSLFSSPAPSNDWSTRFMQEAKELSSLGLEYDEDWRPPGESHSWAMDCSNTSRYLYKVTAGIELPRTASDQYYYLHLQNKAWDVPQASDGYADASYLRENLKPGDLLFWENTYRPERQPPITHVMVYLGTDDKGQWLMVGSQSSRGGLHNRRNGGPDIYVFDPHKPSGGYTTWLGLIRHKGRFCAYGRPLEADPAKLSVASN